MYTEQKVAKRCRTVILAAPQVLQGTPNTPSRVKLRDLGLDMQTQSLRYDRASVQRKDIKTRE